MMGNWNVITPSGTDQTQTQTQTSEFSWLSSLPADPQQLFSSSQSPLPYLPFNNSEQMESRKPKVYFRLTKMDYLNQYKHTTGGRQNCFASDFKQILVSGLVDEIEKIDELPVIYIPKKASPSKSRGGGEVEQRRKQRFLPDKLQPYSVCGTAYDLSRKEHNRLCLLRGILKEWLPDEAYLGKPPLPGFDGIVDLVLRSLENPSSYDSDSDEVHGDSPPPPKRFKRPDFIEGRLDLALGFLKTKMEGCSALRNDEGKTFIQALLAVVVAVGRGAWECCLATATQKKQKTAIVADAVFPDKEQPEDFVSIADVTLRQHNENVVFVFEVKEGDTPEVGEGQLGMHLLLSSIKSSPVFGLIVAHRGSRLMKATKTVEEVSIGVYDNINLKEKEGLLHFVTSLYFILYGTMKI